MAQNQSGSGQPPPEGFSEDRRPDNDSRRKRPSDTESRPAQSAPAPLTAREKWRKAQPTKTILLWACLGAVALTMLVGFTWGGWVTQSTAEKMATAAAKLAVVERLAPICVAQFNQDPEREQKLQVLKDTTTFQQSQYVADQPWAIMPGEDKPDSQVTRECVKLLSEISQ